MKLFLDNADFLICGFCFWLIQVTYAYFSIPTTHGGKKRASGSIVDGIALNPTTTKKKQESKDKCKLVPIIILKHRLH